MRLLTIQSVATTNWQDFINFWSNQYDYTQAGDYDNTIHKSSLTKNDLSGLYKWKNGNNLSNKKQISYENKILCHLNFINNQKSNPDYNLNTHLNHFKDVSAVWNIFLLHIIKPQIYPIYDQHIHRAFAFIHGDDNFTAINQNIKDPVKIDFYKNKYLPFINEHLTDYKLKKIDEAFFSFGRFLKSGNLQNRNFLNS